MLIVGVDTSGKQGSVALARAEGVEVEIIEIVPLAGGTYSAQLIPQLAALLTRHNLDKHRVDGYAVCSGPGSFTGLRVGLSAVKGLAEVLHKPIAAVSMLEAVAAQAHRDGKVLAAIDAGRKQVFVGEYRVEAGEAREGSELLLTQAEFTRLTAESRGAQVITPDEPVAAIAEGLEIKQIEWPGSAAVVRLGAAKLARGEVVSPEALEANYIRRSDAEIFSTPS